MNLYQINAQIQALIYSADENGEINAQALDQLEMQKKDKQENIIKFIKHLKNDEQLLDQEIERLKNMKSMAEKRQEWLMKYLESSMRIDGVNELDFTLFKAKFKKNPPSVVIENEEIIPKDFKASKTVVMIDKQEIKKALKEGVTVPGCHLEQNERLVIT